MTSDPNDYVFVEDQVGPDRRRSRRHVTIADGDWQPVGDATAAGGIAGRLRAKIVVNKIPLDLEIVSTELENVTRSAVPQKQLARQAPTLRVRGRQYRLVSVFAS